MHIKRCIIGTLVAATAAVFPLNASAEDKMDASLSAAKAKALIWLKSQKVPNAAVPDPQPDRRNLIASYEVPKDAPSYKYIFGRSIIYDDALAAIAFTMNRDYKSAGQILQALKRLQRRDGGLWFGYNLNNDWPSESDYSGSVDRNGATAWVGYAAVYYLQARLAQDPDILKTNREAKSILEFAQSLGTYLLTMQIQKSSDPRNGFITGGNNSYSLKLEKNAVNEIFLETPIDWISTEHNIDAYFFLRDLGELTKDEKFIKSAALIKKSMASVWSKKDRQYYRGVKPGFIDTALALDCASWGAVFSLSAGYPEYAKQSLESMEELYASSDKALAGSSTVYGYKPYAKKEIYEDVGSDITKFYFSKLDGTTWDSISGVWVEGSLGAALAYLKAGNKDKAAGIMKNMLLLQGKSGGFIYFTKEVPHEFSTFISTASTAWFIIMASALEDPAIAESFWRK